MKVAIVLEADAVEESSGANLESAGEVLEFGEGFFQFGVEFAIGISEGVHVDEGGEPIVDFDVESDVETLNGEVVGVGVVSVSTDVCEGVGGGVADDAAEVEGGIDFDLGERE